MLCLNPYISQQVSKNMSLEPPGPPAKFLCELYEITAAASNREFQ